MRAPDGAWRTKLDALNAARRSGRPDARLEGMFEASHRVSRRLAVYGTLAPGRENHHLLEGAGGVWREGVFVEGELHPLGWGAAKGFPALRCRPGGHRVPAWLLESEKLPGLWPMLNEFEGPGYCRVLAPVVDTQGKLVALANLYEAAGPA